MKKYNSKFALLTFIIFFIFCSIDAKKKDDVENELFSKQNAAEKFLVEDVINELNAESKDSHYWMLSKLVDARHITVVSDNDALLTKYKIKLLVVQTECLKDIDSTKINLNLCAVSDSAPKQICRYTILVDNESTKQKITKHECHVPKHHHHHAHKSARTEVNEFDLTFDIDKQIKTAGLDVSDSKKIMRTEKNIQRASHVIKPKNLGVWNAFTDFAKRYSKIYETKREVLKRFRIYKRNILAARIWQNNEQGSAVYGETKFMDLTQAEFKKIYLPYQWEQPKHIDHKIDIEESQFSNDPLPQSFDWRTEGAVTEVKDQKTCGSCWAFSVTGNIEGQWKVRKGELVSLSEQELLDCDKVDKACNGGLPANAYQEIIRIGGLEKENDYPYDAHLESCKLSTGKISAKISNWTQLPADEQKMAQFLVKNGPISVGVNANPLQFYRHGISHPWKIFCSALFLDHGVLIVGFGQEGNKPFWIIKNSWGKNWGEHGYYRLYRGKNVCGVATMATSALV